MAVKLIMKWDILADHEQEYFEFIVREFIPGVQQLGFDLTDAWATVFGHETQIMIGALLPELEDARKLLFSPEWQSLHNKLRDFVTNYSQKIVKARGGFQF